jgi:predicted GIY-YIG superfamily endonuclease
MTAPYCCYCLRSQVTRRTYVGITNNLQRRLRQHNGEIKGGAQYTTQGRPWELALFVTGFTCQKEVLSFEWAWKHAKRNRASGVTGRKNQLLALLSRERWTSKAPPAKTVPLVLHWARGVESFVFADDTGLPSHVTQMTVAPDATSGTLSDSAAEPTQSVQDDPGVATGGSGSPSEWDKALAEWEAASMEADSARDQEQLRLVQLDKKPRLTESESESTPVRGVPG